MAGPPWGSASALKVIGSPAAKFEPLAGSVIWTLGFPVGGPTLTVTEALELAPAPLVAESVTVWVPSVGIRYLNDEAPVPTGVPSTDQTAAALRSPSCGSKAE